MRRSFLLVGLVASLGCAVAACAGGGEQDLNPQPLPPGPSSGTDPTPPVDTGGAANPAVGDTNSSSSSAGSSGAGTSSGSSGSSGTSGGTSSSGSNSSGGNPDAGVDAGDQ